MKKMTADEHAKWVADNWNRRLPQGQEHLKASVEFDRVQVYIEIAGSEVVRYLHGERPPMPVVIAEDPKLRDTFLVILKAYQAEITTMLREIPEFPYQLIEWEPHEDDMKGF